MSNHVHLLIKTHHEDIGATIKHLAVVYAMYFNHKYSRAGHLFQDRFKSEPVNISSKTVSSLNPSTTWPILQHSCATSIKTL